MRKNFKRKLHLACGKDDLRPVFNHLYFEDGNIICTDAHILICQSLKKNGFTDNEIKIMNGKFLHSDAFKIIYKQKNVYVTEEGFKCVNKNFLFTIPFSPPPGVFPKWREVIPDLNDSEPINRIGLNLKLIQLVRKITLSKSLGSKLEFSARNKGVVIYPNDSDFTDKDELILIMPITII